ncbi:rano class II histocompatibility antigen, A beta chain-like [Centroberyx gerrardi]
MYIGNFLFCIVFSLLSLVFSDGDFVQSTACCTLKGPGLKDTEYTIMERFNKKLVMQYNSTRGNWTGFTAFAVRKAKAWTDDPYDALGRVLQKALLCDRKRIDAFGGDFTAMPNVKLNSVKLPSGRHPSMLVCSAYDFYPKQIRVTWLRDGREVTSDVSFSEVMADGDFYYQIHSYLEYTATPGEKITCMVEHLGLTEPVLQVWDASLPESERNKIVVGGFGLLLGFVFLSAGLIYYKKKSAAHITLCQGPVLIPVENLPAAERTEQTEQPLV